MKLPVASAVTTFAMSALNKPFTGFSTFGTGGTLTSCHIDVA